MPQLIFQVECCEISTGGLFGNSNTYQQQNSPLACQAAGALQYQQT
jgi:hypothetical protein